MKIKKWNGSAWVQEYPEVNVANIVATGTASGSTFLRGDGTWATPSDVDTNNYLTGVSGSGNGTITYTRQGLTDLTFNAAHTHTEYLKYNPDNDGIAISYDDSNPTINGQSVGGGHTFGADGSLTNGYLNAKVLLANGSTNSVSGYYVGAMTPSTGGSSTQVIDGSGNWVGNAIAAAKLASHTHAISDVTNLQTSLDGKAASSHTHAIADVTNLQTTLDGKAASSHTHDDRYYTETETTNLLNTKASLIHNHSASEIVTGELNTARLGSGTATAGLVLKSDGDGTASWQSDNNTTYSLGSFGVTATASELNLLDGEAITTTELNYLSGVTSSIQTQINGKQNTITNNVAGSTFSGAYLSPGGGTNTGVILYGDYYGWHTRSIGAAGTALISNGSTPNWSSAGIATYSTATLYIKRIYTRTASSAATWTERYDAGTGTGTAVSTTSTWTTLALGATPSTTEQFLIEFSNSSSNSQETGICMVGYGTNQSTAGMAVISYDAYEIVDNNQLKLAKYYCQWYVTGSSIGFRYGSKLTW